MSFDKEREQAIEKKFEMDQQVLFKIEARASRLVGIWAAGKMGLSPADADAYSKEVVIANLDEPGYDDVKRKLVADFSRMNISVPEHEIDYEISKCVEIATEQIKKESKQ